MLLSTSTDIQARSEREEREHYAYFVIGSGAFVPASIVRMVPVKGVVCSYTRQDTVCVKVVNAGVVS